MGAGRLTKKIVTTGAAAHFNVTGCTYCRSEGEENAKRAIEKKILFVCVVPPLRLA